ncbi:OLC1v1020398C1 [Oldenlandia corymbosa var. corymbosa]|uniref:OLC1v1020398C1 n=1 Tax=Oldenlandia corymbosa var. corymbosa TaxID=529605 RepID=A0AAV1EGG4_OLDCO|nr:OLC1v1020398C1 [Oldenlandia corymbosa var. corymbosa]
MKGRFSQIIQQKVRSWPEYRIDYQWFSDVLKSCATNLDANLGRTLHSNVVKLGHGSCQLVSKALLNMYAKCNALDDCQRLFHQIQCCDTVMWNIVLSGFAGSRIHDLEAMSFFRSMHASQETEISTVSLAIILPVCARIRCLSFGQSVHCYATKGGLDSDTLVGNALVSMYAKSRFVVDAYNVFDGIAEKDVISWNAIISGFLENELLDDAFEMFQGMLRWNICPNYATIVNVLPLCARLKENFGGGLGMAIHAYVVRRTELAVEISVLNALLSFYLRIGQLEYAKTLFNNMQFKDLVSWNSMIAGFSRNGEYLRALEMFYELVVLQAMAPDPVTLVSILPSCGQLQYANVGKQIHGYVVHHPVLREDTNVQNAIISFYSNCKDRGSALKTFFSMSKKDLVSWNTILDCLCETESRSEFVDLLRVMFRERLNLDSVSILTIIRFCSSVSRIDKVKEAHGFSLKYGILLSDDEPTVGNALIDAYAKCGNLDYAYKIFECVSRRKNLITWNSMISGFVNHGAHEDAFKMFQNMTQRDQTTWNLMVRVYAANGFPAQALSLFHEMQLAGVKPDAMSIMSLLPVCAQSASVSLLKQLHGYVVRACFADVHLMAALLDMYSKCGNVNYASSLFHSTARKDLVLFTSMIGGYATNGMGEKAIQVFHHMLDSGQKPDNVIMTTVLSACNHSGLVDEGLKIFDSIQQVHHMKPSVEQYACLVDLLARKGRIKDAYSLAHKVPIEASSNIWGALLAACTIHNEVEMAQSISSRLTDVNAATDDVGNYVALSNLYASNASWDGVLKMRRLIKTKDLKKPSGCSWIEVENSKHEFLAGDYSHPKRGCIYEVLSTLDQHIKELYEYFTL